MTLAGHNSIRKKGVAMLVCEIKALKAELRALLTGFTVAMVTFYIKKMTITYSPMIELIVWYINVTSTDKEWYNMSKVIN